MSLDYDLYVIDPANNDTRMSQLRDCLKDAIDELAKRTAVLSDRLNKLENGAAVADNKDLSEEPLFKDEKVRKAVRAWAEANDVDKMKVSPFAVYNIESPDGIYFRHRIVEDNSYDEFRYYTTTELCGEEG